jgi:hypothetical protein
MGDVRWCDVGRKMSHDGISSWGIASQRSSHVDPPPDPCLGA